MKSVLAKVLTLSILLSSSQAYAAIVCAYLDDDFAVFESVGWFRPSVKARAKAKCELNGNGGCVFDGCGSLSDDGSFQRESLDGSEAEPETAQEAYREQP